MSDFLPADVLDGLLEVVATSTRLSVCSGPPADYSEIAGVSLADGTLSSGDFTIDDDPVSGGRRLSVDAPSSLTVDAAGTATHLAMDDGSILLYVREIEDPQALLVGNTVSPTVLPIVVPPAVAG